MNKASGEGQNYTNPKYMRHIYVLYQNALYASIEAFCINCWRLKNEKDIAC